MNEQAYFETYSAFIGSMKQDAQTLLALCDAWLDPVYMLQANGDYDPLYDEDWYEWKAISAARDMWPTLYAEMTWMAWEGQGDSAIEIYTCDWMNDHIPSAIMSFEELYGGIPMQYMGRDDEDNSHAATAECEVIDKLMDGISYRALDILNEGYKTSCPEMVSTLDWIFGRSGNSSFDYSWSSASETFSQYMEWTEENLDFAWEIHLEAWEFAALKDDGLDMLTDDDVMFDLIESAMISLSAGMQRILHDHRRTSNEFKRPGNVDERSESGPAAVHQLLPNRDRDAA